MARLSLSFGQWALILILALLGARLLSLGLYPLYDTTEARYGEIARIMFETHNWVTPQFDYNVPFWGKPPFQTWISAASFSLFGVSEFTARLPHFLCALLVVVMVYWMARRFLGAPRAMAAVLILSSSLGFIVSAGMVMTDAALLMACTLAMVSYWYAYQQVAPRVHGYLFFAALALGMLIKGPVAVVLVGIALLSWSLSQRCLVRALAVLPWGSGLLLFLALTLPWYVWAELRSPGFLDYFLWGEHVQRFLVSGWQGDLYGSAHDKPRGTIWFYWLAAACPWSLVLLYRALRWWQARRGGNRGGSAGGDQLTPYLLCWMLSPMLLFTLAGNILPAYVLPGFSAMALLVASRGELNNRVVLLASSSLVLVLLVIVVFAGGLTSKTSESQLLGRERLFNQQAQLYYWQKRPFSAQFYSKGQAQLLDSEDRLRELVAGDDLFYLAMTPSANHAWQALLSGRCKTESRTAKRVLLICGKE